MNVTIKPEILATLRNNRRMPTQVMASKLKISEDEYKLYEERNLEVTVEEAQKIAKIFKRNWTVFLLNEPPEKPNFDQDHRTESNQKGGIGYKTYDALEEARYLLDFVVNINSVGENRIPVFHAGMSPIDMAAEFRKKIGLPYEEQPKFKTKSELIKFWTGILTDLGINVSAFQLGDDDGVRAFSILKDNRAIVVLNTEETDNGKLFSLMHELAHILIRNTGVCDLHRDNIENFCNMFASEILVPATVFQKAIEQLDINDDTAYEIAEKLARRLGVSRLAVLTRLLKLKKITPKKYDVLFVLERTKFQVQRDHKRKRSAESNTKPKINPYTVRRARMGNLFLGEVLGAYYQSKISPFEASKYLGFSVGSIGKFNDWVARNGN